MLPKLLVSLASLGVFLSPFFTTTINYVAPPVHAQNISVEAPQESLDDHIRIVAAKWGIATSTLKNLVISESDASGTVVADHGCSVGWVQINLCAHPEISTSSAENIDFALNYAAQSIHDGTDYQFTSCSCSRTASTVVPGMPVRNAQDYPSNATMRTGKVVKLRYGDVYHVAVIKDIKLDGIYVYEGNFTPCKLGYRLITWDEIKQHLVGFYTPGASVD